MRLFYNLLLVLASVLVALVAGELMARLVLDPVDYLLPQVVPDDVLSYRIEPNSGGHDAWGFRNPRVPRSAQIVCIGDSMTYGEQALASESWPAVLQKLSGKTVYNMSLGGYGPTQYLYLMQNEAPKLHPDTVIVGFYFGNDFMDTYNETHFNKYWRTYANVIESTEHAPPILAIQPPPGRFLPGLRGWLSAHSVLFAVLARSRVFDFFRAHELRTEMEHEPGEYFSYRDDRHYVFFNMRGAALLDLGDPRIKSAMEMVEHIMLDMRTTAAANGFRLVIALIPTKERVYATLLSRAGYEAKFPELQHFIQHEDTARNDLILFLSQNGIESVDLLPELAAAVKDRDIYPLNNPHPDRLGYEVIANTINQYLNHSHK